MTEVAAHWVDEVLPAVPFRQWVLTVPYDLRYLLAWHAGLRSAVLGAFLRAVDAHYQQVAKTQGLIGVRTAAISVLQRFDSALRCSPHWHVLYADGVWAEGPSGPVFQPAPPLDTLDVAGVLHDACLRIGRQLARFGWQEREIDTLRDEQPALAHLLGEAVQGRQVTGPEAGRAVRRERAGPAGAAMPRPHGRNCVEVDGYSLHANTRVGALARDDLERLCKYLMRPAIAANRVEVLDDEHVRLTLKKEWQDGTRAITLRKADLVVRLAAQIPLPRKPSVRYHGCFAPNAAWRPHVVPAGAKPKCRRKKVCAESPDGTDDRVTSTRMAWALGLKRAFARDLLECPCGGRRVVLAAVQDKSSLERILRHLSLWHDPEDIVAIRGPPEDLWPADLDPYDPSDVVDEVGDLDQAA